MNLPKKSGVNVFLVDDDELILKIFSSKFKTSTSYNIHSFSSGEDFLEFILKNPGVKKQINIVVLDYMLSVDGSKKNGLEILCSIKEYNPDFEVIMLSGKGDIDTAISAMHHGALTFIEKSENSFARINNNIQMIVSEKSLRKVKRQSVSSTKIFFMLILGIGVIMGILYLIFPEIF